MNKRLSEVLKCNDKEKLFEAIPGLIQEYSQAMLDSVQPFSVAEIPFIYAALSQMIKLLKAKSPDAAGYGEQLSREIKAIAIDLTKLSPETIKEFYEEADKNAEGKR